MKTPERTYAIVKEIAARTSEINPACPYCMDNVMSSLDAGELTLAVEFFFQMITNPDDWLIDVRLYDLIYMIHLCQNLKCEFKYELSSFNFLEEEVVKIYEG